MTEQNRAEELPERPIADVAVFVVLAFLITWGTGMLVVLSTHAGMVNGAHLAQHPIPLPLAIAVALMMIGGFGPFLAATAVTALRSGRPGVRELFRQFRRWRVHPIRYAAAFLGPALLGFVALCITALFGGARRRTGSPIHVRYCLPAGPSAPGAKSWVGAALRNRNYRSDWVRWVPVWSWAQYGPSGTTGQ